MEIKLNEIISWGDTRMLLVEMDAPLEQWMAQLSNFDSYAEQYNALRTDKRKREFLVARIACNLLMGAQVEVAYDKNQKPFLRNATQKISISHAKNIVCVAVHPSHEIGVDIEYATERLVKLQNRFCNANELQKFANNAQALLIIWCAKESLYKVIGKAAVDFSKHLEVIAIHQSSATIEALHLPTGEHFKLHYSLNEQLCMAMCWKMG